MKKRADCRQVIGGWEVSVAYAVGSQQMSAAGECIQYRHAHVRTHTLQCVDGKSDRTVSDGSQWE